MATAIESRRLRVPQSRRCRLQPRAGFLLTAALVSGCCRSINQNPWMYPADATKTSDCRIMNSREGNLILIVWRAFRAL